MGFKHWRHTAYADQAIAMLIAFGSDLDMAWLGPELHREKSLDALAALHEIAGSGAVISHERLDRLLDQLHAGGSGSQGRD